MHGIDVIAVPTTLLSNRPGYPSLRGRVLDAPLVADLLRGIEERGAVETCGDDPVRLSRLARDRRRGRGFRRARQNPQPETDLLLRPRARRSRPRPVRPADIPPLVRDRLCPLADIITPNHFEFEFLCGAKATTSAQVIAAAQALMARGPSTVIVTSAELEDTPRGEIETLGRSNNPAPGAWARQSCRSARTAPAICLPRYSQPRAFRERTRRVALGHAVSAIFAVLERTAARGTEEMRIVESGALLVHPARRFEPIAIGS